MPVEAEKLNPVHRQLLKCYWRALTWKKLGHVVTIKTVADYVEEDFKWGDLTRATTPRYINELIELGFVFDLADGAKLEKKTRKPRPKLEIKHTVAEDPTPIQAPKPNKKLVATRKARKGDPLVPQLRRNEESGTDELIGQIDLDEPKTVNLPRPRLTKNTTSQSS